MWKLVSGRVSPCGVGSRTCNAISTPELTGAQVTLILVGGDKASNCGGGIGRRMGCSGDGNTDKNVRYCSQGFDSQQPEQTSAYAWCKSMPAKFLKRSKNE